jgi:hypothetical protein
MVFHLMGDLCEALISDAVALLHRKWVVSRSNWTYGRSPTSRLCRRVLSKNVSGYTGMRDECQPK